MSLPELFTFVKANSFSAIIATLLIYIVLRGEITFRYPGKAKRDR